MTQISSPEYKNHEVFSALKAYADFYDSLSMSVFQQITMGTSAITNIDTYLFSSIKGTLESIRFILERGRISDAFALLRKYYDVATVNIYSNLLIEREYLKMLCQSELSFEPFVVQPVNDWLHGRLPKGFGFFDDMIKDIKKSKELGEIYSLIISNGKYNIIRERGNSHMHLNFFQATLLNDGEVFVKDRLDWLNKFKTDLDCILIYHMVLIFSLKQLYMISSDHLDHLECGQTPPEDSQYWVNHRVQKILSEIVQAQRPDLYELLKLRSSMHLA